MHSTAAGRELTRPPLQGLRKRIAAAHPDELAWIMARRELFRCLAGRHTAQAVGLAMLAASLLCLLIPLHRASRYPVQSTGGAYFFSFSLAIQVGLAVLAGSTVWAGMRRDAATGTAEELQLTGASPAQVLVGKWLGTCAAGAFWTLALLPLLVFATALTGTALTVGATVGVCWFLSAAGGALVGTFVSLAERPRLGHWGLALFYTVQGWVLLRWLLPKVGAGLGSGWSDWTRWIVYADPITLLPAAVGAVREPWALKAAVLVAAMAGAAAWLLVTQRPIALPGPQEAGLTSDGFFLLRPVRRWLTSYRPRTAPEYGRSVVYPFERAHGWRLRIGTVAWTCILPVVIVPAPVLVVLGPPAHHAAVALLVMAALTAAAVGSVGVAASLAGEREQARWAFLLTSPLSRREIVRAKWQAAWMEGWPIWAVMAVQAPLFALWGLLPWSALPAALVGAPLVAGVATAATACACALAPSLAAAQQRVAVVLLVPPGAVLLSAWLLPQLHNLKYISLPHVLSDALQTGPPEGILASHAALIVHAILGALCVEITVRQLQARPPI